MHFYRIFLEEKFVKKGRSLSRRREVWQEVEKFGRKKREVWQKGEKFGKKELEVWQEEEKFRMNERSSSKGREVFQDRDKFVIVKKKRIASKEIEKFGKKREV